MEQAIITKAIRIKFRRHDGSIVEDEIRGFFNHEDLLEPYARNTTTPAAVLTEHSWILLSDIVEFVDEAWLAHEGCPAYLKEDGNESKESKESPQVAVVEFDDAYSVSAGDEEVDSVYFDVAQDDAGQWFMSASLDCESSHFTIELVVDYGPYDSEEAALQAGLNTALEWMAANDYSEYEVDSRLTYIVGKEA